jgi:hypothetical protein
MNVMKYIKNCFFSFLCLLLLSSCEKVIDLDLGNKTGDLVIEGNITDTNAPQLVKLSTNVPFTNTNTYPPVSGATVLITDDQGNSFAPPETAPGTYSTASFTGVYGRSYSMTVAVNGKTYTASSKMPVSVKLDSVTTRVNEFEKKQRDITVHYQDPAGAANQYRFVMYINDKQVKAVFALNDDFNDGKYVHADLDQDDVDVFPGDTVRVEMQCIDNPVYTYWLTLVQQQDSGPGGGVAPSNPPTNISPKTLGYFSAHTTQVISIVAR